MSSDDAVGGNPGWDGRAAAVPAFIAADNRADYLAGWVAGHAAALTAGPLRDEIAREIVLILDVVGPPAGQARQRYSTAARVTYTG